MSELDYMDETVKDLEKTQEVMVACPEDVDCSKCKDLGKCIHGIRKTISDLAFTLGQLIHDFKGTVINFQKGQKIFMGEEEEVYIKDLSKPDYIS